jgi:hypothetical protein
VSDPSPRPATRDWTADELAALAAGDLLRLSARRADGSSTPTVPVGHVRVDGDELVRSLRGPQGHWFRTARATHRGTIAVGGRTIDVVFAEDAGREERVDAAYRDRYGDDAGVRSMIRSPAREATLRFAPAATPIP